VGSDTSTDFSVYGACSELTLFQVFICDTFFACSEGTKTARLPLYCSVPSLISQPSTVVSSNFVHIGNGGTKTNEFSAQMCGRKFWKGCENLRPVYKKPFSENIEWLLPFWTFKFIKSTH
jgi:hypothetical protein